MKVITGFLLGFGVIWVFFAITGQLAYAYELLH
jgi:hypothetical protein